MATRKPGKPVVRRPAPHPSNVQPSYADLVRIVEVLRSTERFSEFRLKAGDIEIEVRRAQGAQVEPPAIAFAGPAAPGEPAPAVPVSTPGPAADVAALPPGLALVRAPSMGVFYRAPKPGAPPFVEPGSRVEADTTVGLVEVMKLFSSVAAGCSGTVTHVLVADGAAVVEGQPVVAIRPGA